ncbi:MAG: phenylacetic acid degradation protein paaN [Alteromonadaceae bacterium]|jgi:phenylacetic acid degradation protein paaN
MSDSLFKKHQHTLDGALTAIVERGFFSAYPEIPSGKIYGKNAKADGEAAFEALLNQPFILNQPAITGSIGNEKSPFGMALGISYPQVDLDELLPAMQAQIPSWRNAGIEVRTGICLEILAKINQRSFEMGYSVMHTSGQGFAMAFQAGGPHAQDRGLEAVAYAYREMSQTAPTTTWVKPQGKREPLSIEKTYRIVPKGIGLVVACATFPTWNSYPGLFASLMTGNPVVIKPHPGAILPLAITVEVAQQVLAENGFAPYLVSLVCDGPETPIAKVLAVRDEVKLIDFTGSSAFGRWLEENARQARVYTEKAGVNSIVIDSCEQLKPLIQNLTFSLCLYSGQMCTTPQNIYIPEDGIMTSDGHLNFDEVAQVLAQGIDTFLSDPQRASEVLGAIVFDETIKRIQRAAVLGEVILPSKVHRNEQFPEATLCSPLIVKINADDEQRYMQELFGPIVCLIPTKNTTHSIALATLSAKAQGAITWGVYSTDDEVLVQMEEASLDAAVALSCNLTGGLFVNQAAAFSDFHASGANPAANASLTDTAFVSGRFAIVQSRRHSV